MHKKHLVALGISSSVLFTACTWPGSPAATETPTPSINDQTQMSVETPTPMPSPTESPSPTPSPASQSKPAGKQNIDDVLKKRAELSRIFSFISAAKLDTVLQGPGPFTIFAPSNTAIAKANQGMIANLTNPKNVSLLANTLSLHVVPGVYNVVDLHDGDKLSTLEGTQLIVTKKGSVTFINGIPITIKDIPASNGVVQEIDGVLTLPQ